MPNSSSCVKSTPDGRYIFATGDYKPRIKCYETKQLSLKFERYLDYNAVNFLCLSEGYEKLAILTTKRWVEFHTQQGKHYKFRTPKQGRDLCYNSFNCDLITVGSSNEVYRMNLEEGRFMQPYTTSMSDINTCVVNDEHHLLMVGGSDGVVECWDHRMRDRVATLDTLKNKNFESFHNHDVTVLKYMNYHEFLLGTSSGHVMKYDMRSSRPLVTYDQRNDYPIHSVYYNTELECVVSADKRNVKLWDINTAKPITYVEPKPQVSSLNRDQTEVNIRGLHMFENSGLMMMANDSPKILVYFVPWLGKAPKWANYLDALVDGQEEEVRTEYRHTKFVTRQQLQDLGLEGLIGTEACEAHGHGFRVDLKTIQKAQEIHNPEIYEEMRARKIKENRKKKEEQKIIRFSKPTKKKVNAEYYNELEQTAGADPTKLKGKKKKQQAMTENLLKDSRFKAMFEDAKFTIDRESDQYKLMHPTQNAGKQQRHQADEDSRSDRGGDSDSEDSSESEDESWIKTVKEGHKEVRNPARHQRAMERREDERVTSDVMSRDTTRMFVPREEVSLDSKKDLDKFGGLKRRHEMELEKELTMEEKIANMETEGRPMKIKNISGGKEAVFYPERKKQKQKEKEEKKELKEKKKEIRSAEHLVPKPKPFKGFRR